MPYLFSTNECSKICSLHLADCTFWKSRANEMESYFLCTFYWSTKVNQQVPWPLLPHMHQRCTVKLSAKVIVMIRFQFFNETSFHKFSNKFLRVATNGKSLQFFWLCLIFLNIWLRTFLEKYKIYPMDFYCIICLFLVQWFQVAHLLYLFSWFQCTKPGFH